MSKVVVEESDDSFEMEDTEEGNKHHVNQAGKKIFMERWELPENFAEEVMENEFAIEEGNFSI